MKIKQSPKSDNVLMVLTPCEVQLVLAALQSHMKIRGAELADTTEINQMDTIINDLKASLDLSTQIMEVTDGNNQM